MSDIKSTSANTNIIPARRSIDKTTMAPFRAYYSPKSAMQFKGVFDKMIETQMNQEIHAKDSGFTVNTLYQKSNDALKWLSECHPTEADKYAALRSRVSIRRMEDRILLYFKSSMSYVIAQSAVSVNPTTTKGWKEELQEWLVNAQEGEIWERREISITPDDKAWLFKLLAGLGNGVEVELKVNEVRIMR